jgi:hypothetical protein
MNNMNQPGFVWEHPEFAFYLPGTWRQLATEDEKQLELYSDQTETRITLSIEPMGLPKVELENWADRLLSLRKKAHQDWLDLPENSNKGRSVIITNEKLELLADVESIEVSYTGQYKGVSTFGFIGYVTTRKIVSMFCETKLSFAPGRAGVFQTVANGFKNKLP